MVEQAVRDIMRDMDLSDFAIDQLFGEMRKKGIMFAFADSTFADSTSLAGKTVGSAGLLRVQLELSFKDGSKIVQYFE